MSRIVLLLTAYLCFCSLACRTAGPGHTLSSDEGKARKLGKVSARGHEMVSPFRFTIPGKGRLVVPLGNPQGKAVEITFSSGTPSSAVLMPGSWQALILDQVADELEITWPQGPLLIGEVYREGDAANPTNLMLISIDTLRYDAFTPTHMPRTHALFSQGLIFERAYTPTPWTLPAHASLLTGRYPVEHGVRLPDQKLSNEAVTLAESLRAAGYFSLAITEGNYLSSSFGLDQGFHLYYEDAPHMMDQNPVNLSKLAGNLEQARTYLKRFETFPLFFFFHTYEVHCPYLPRNGRTDPDGLGMTRWLLKADGKPLGDDFDKIRDLYLGEVGYTDELLADFLEPLIASGRWTIVLVSDHGEEFGDHGGLLHADTLYEEVMRVPLAMVGPQITAGYSTEPVSLADVAPTLLDLSGLTPPAEWSGRNLRKPGESRPLYGESFFFGPHIKVTDPRLLGIWFGGDKLIQTRNFATFQAELFDLEDDPQEQTNLQSQRAAERDALFLLIQAYEQGQGLKGEAIDALTPEQLEIMRALGYVE